MPPISTSFGRNRSRRPKLFFPKFSRGRKNFRGDEKVFAAKKFRNARTIERTRCQKVPGKRCSRVVIDGYKIDPVGWQYTPFKGPFKAENKCGQIPLEIKSRSCLRQFLSGWCNLWHIAAAAVDERSSSMNFPSVSFQHMKYEMKLY